MSDTENTRIAELHRQLDDLNGKLGMAQARLAGLHQQYGGAGVKPARPSQQQHDEAETRLAEIDQHYEEWRQHLTRYDGVSEGDLTFQELAERAESEARLTARDAELGQQNRGLLKQHPELARQLISALEEIAELCQQRADVYNELARLT